MANTALRRKPLVEICRREGWTPRYLSQQPSDGDTAVDLLLRELQDLRESGRQDLSDLLLEAAREQGIKDSRLPSTATTGTPQRCETDSLAALRKICQKAEVSPTFLVEDLSEGIELACAKEMQLLRQSGSHQLVVALGRRALKLGLDHPRIQSNMSRSDRQWRRDSLMTKVEELLSGKQSAKEKAEALMLAAIVDDPDFRLCRLRFEQCLRERLAAGNDDSLASELLDQRVGLEFNRRRLELLEQRFSAAIDQDQTVANQTVANQPG